MVVNHWGNIDQVLTVTLFQLKWPSLRIRSTTKHILTLGKLVLEDTSPCFAESLSNLLLILLWWSKRRNVRTNRCRNAQLYKKYGLQIFTNHPFSAEEIDRLSTQPQCSDELNFLFHILCC